MDNETAEVAATKSIIDPKYAQAYKDKPKDWFALMVDEQATVAATKEKKTKITQLDEDDQMVLDANGKPVIVDGPVEIVTLKKRSVDLGALFAFAQANSIDTAKYEAQADRPNAPGRLRMTIGNMLRAAAKHRHGLFDKDNVWHDAPEEFLGDAVKTQEQDGTKIPKVQPKVAEPEADTAED